MKNVTAIGYTGLLLASLIVFVGVTSALKCYECKSSTTPTCSKTVSVALGVSIAEGCSCCMKRVTSSVTSRECVDPLSSYMCDNQDTGIYLCTTDFCNSTDFACRNRIAMATIVTSLVIGSLIACYI